MSKPKPNLEEKWDELMEELERVNSAFPKVEEMDGWIPRDVFEEKEIVLAVKYEDPLIVFQEFKPVGIWEKVYDLMVSRKKIIREMDKIASKLDGPAVFTSKEFAPNDFVTGDE